MPEYRFEVVEAFRGIRGEAKCGDQTAAILVLAHYLQNIEVSIKVDSDSSFNLGRNINREISDSLDGMTRALAGIGSAIDATSNESAKPPPAKGKKE